MYNISDEIKIQEYNKLQVKKLVNKDSLEILCITLEKDTLFPEHTSPRDAELFVLEGAIEFHINGTTYNLKTQQHFNFPGETVHWVLATENSKFLIIR
ncbi:cupin domain-containing protein [uncultured Muriicola sp.]|uniref:cupin domain-containing protein n=1 Tax=uncultured Muriicola sp. TaxID=1583102 RepID=UPI00260B3F78|nr:cupin domain-containing protein [uncultured Muriicola sp.]